MIYNLANIKKLALNCRQGIYNIILGDTTHPFHSVDGDSGCYRYKEVVVGCEDGGHLG